MTENIFTKSTEVSSNEIIVFLRKFQISLNRAIPLVHSFKIIASETSNPVLRDAIIGLAKNVAENHVTLYTAFKEYDTIFSPLTLDLIFSGEETGELVQTLGDIILILQTELAHP